MCHQQNGCKLSHHPVQPAAAVVRGVQCSAVQCVVWNVHLFGVLTNAIVQANDMPRSDVAAAALQHVG